MVEKINFRESDFTSLGKRNLYELCERLREDIKTSEDSNEEKLEATKELNYFLCEYEKQCKNYYKKFSKLN